MARAKKANELRLSGSTLGTRFSLIMSIALAVVMLAAGAFLYSRVIKVAERIQENAFVEAIQNQAPLQKQLQEELRAELLGLKSPQAPVESAMPIKDRPSVSFANGDVVRLEVLYGEKMDKTGYLYQFKDMRPPLIVPMTLREQAGQGLFALILGVTLCVIFVGACVAWMVAKTVSRPLETIVDDIAQISRGDLRHRTRVRAGGEIMLLAKSIDRMAGNLEEAQEAQLELSKRDREIALAGDVREAMLPESTPVVSGYELGAMHVDSPTPGGDFHDFIELDDGRVGLLICSVSGRGIPGAMIGAIARSYLRVELARGGDVSRALQAANGHLVRDVRRGMFVTAMYVLLSPATGELSVACAGHKLPLLRYVAADKKVRLVQPEGIALGFDKGPVFARALQAASFVLAPGDRILISNTGPVQVVDADGGELGEKAFYRLVQQHATLNTVDLLAQIQRSMHEHAGDTPFPNDISIITVARSS